MVALSADPTRGIIPSVEPLDAIASTPKPTASEAQADASAPAAAHWLQHPDPPAPRVTLAMQLADEREYDPALDGPEESEPNE